MPASSRLRAFPLAPALAAVPLVVVGFLLGFDELSRAWLADHRTGTGETKVVVLDDGTQVQLDADTAISVDFSAAARRVRPVGVALALLASGWGAVALASEAKAATQSYKIPAGPVASALSRLADASGAQVIYDSELTRNSTTRGVEGRQTLSDALDTVLAGTGLDYRLAPDGKAVTIQLAQAAPSTVIVGKRTAPPSLCVALRDAVAASQAAATSVAMPSA